MEKRTVRLTWASRTTRPGSDTSNPQNNNKMDIDLDRVPNTMEEAVATLVAGFSETDKATVRGLSSPAAMHFGLGGAMRNNWSFWEDTPLRRDCVARWRIAHADDLSGLLLAWVFARLRDEPFDPEEHCEIYHEHWKETAGMTALEAAGIKPEPE